MRSVSYRRPRRLLLHVDRWTLTRRRVRFADGGDHPALRRIEEPLVRWSGRSATADDHVHRSLAGIDHVGGGRRGDRRPGGVRFPAADWVRALVVAPAGSGYTP